MFSHRDYHIKAAAAAAINEAQCAPRDFVNQEIITDRLMVFQRFYVKFGTSFYKTESLWHPWCVAIVYGENTKEILDIAWKHCLRQYVDNYLNKKPFNRQMIIRRINTWKMQCASFMEKSTLDSINQFLRDLYKH